jgi:2,3-bisphosphoglycerate-independent phosphoglycerate mutase
MIEKIVPKEPKQNAIETANMVNMFLNAASEILNTHPINERREMRGLAPANFLLIESPSTEQKDLKRQKNWLALTYHPEPTGFALLSGMKTYALKYPEQKTIDAYGNMYEAITQLAKITKNVLKDNYKDYEYVYIHIKELAFAGYDNKPVEKKMLLEHLDKTLFALLKDFCPEKRIKVCIMSSVAIPCKLKVNSSMETPILLYNNQIPRKVLFTQENCKRGTLGKIEGKDFLDKIKFN